MFLSKLLFLVFLIGFCYGKPQYPETIIRPPGRIPTSENDVIIDVKAAEEEPDKSEPPKSNSLPKIEQPQPPPRKLQEPPKIETSNTKLDDSELQKVETKSPAPEESKSERKYKYNDCLSDTIFVVDSTSSVRQIFEKHRNYVSNVIKNLDISPEKNHVGVIVYSSKYRQRVKISLADPQDKGNVSKIVNNLPFFSGVTATGQALRLAQQDLKNKRSNVVTNLVVITDGFSYDYIDDPVKELHQVENLRLFAVSLSEACRKFELLMISGTEDNLFEGDDSYKKLLTRLQQCDEKTASGNSITDNAEGGVGAEFASGEKEQGGEKTSKSSSSEFSESNENNGNDKGDEKTSQSSSSSSSESEEKDENENEDSGEKESENCVHDVVFVIDASGSLRHRYLRQIELASEIVDVFDEHSNFALIKYSGKRQIKVSIPLESNTTASEFKLVISKESFMGGTTFTDLALDKAAEQLNGPGRNKDALPIVIVFTDGFSRNDPLPNAKKLHQASIPVFAVGVSDGHIVNERELRDIASSPDNVYLDTNFQALKDTLSQLSKKC